MVYWSHTRFFPGKENKQIVRVPLFVLPHAFLRVFYFKCRWKGDVLEAHFNSTFPFAFPKSHSKNLMVSLQEMFNFLRSAFPQTVTEGKRKQQQKHVLDCFDMFWPSTPKGVMIFSGGQHGKLSLSLKFACRKGGAELYLFSRRFRVFSRYLPTTLEGDGAVEQMHDVLNLLVDAFAEAGDVPIVGDDFNVCIGLIDGDDFTFFCSTLGRLAWDKGMQETQCWYIGFYKTKFTFPTGMDRYSGMKVGLVGVLMMELMCSSVSS